jgi:hypothetical protein
MFGQPDPQNDADHRSFDEEDPAPSPVNGTGWNEQQNGYNSYPQPGSNEAFRQHKLTPGSLRRIQRRCAFRLNLVIFEAPILDS